MKRSTFTVSLALILGVSAAAIAQGQSQPQTGQWHDIFNQACGADIQKYCSSSQDREARHTCIKANTDKFSDACKTFLASHNDHTHWQGHMHGQDQTQGQAPQ